MQLNTGKIQKKIVKVLDGQQLAIKQVVNSIIY